jgi:hypothetical protein
MRLPRLRRSKEDTLAPATPVSAQPAPSESPRGLAKWQAILEEQAPTPAAASLAIAAVSPDVIVRSPVSFLSAAADDDSYEVAGGVVAAVVGGSGGLGSSRSRTNTAAPPRWLADHADANVQQYRANAQLGALSALCPVHPLLCD